MVAGGRPISEPRLSPDASSVVFSTNGTRGVTQLVRIDLSDTVPLFGGPEVVLNSEPAPAGVHPEGGGSFCWCPDGESLVYAARDGGLYRVSVAGGAATLIVAAPDPDHWLGSPAVSPNGRWLICALTSDGSNLIALHRLDGTGALELVGEGRTADFRVDPMWIDNETVAWHEWSNPSMPWDGSRIVCARIIDGRSVGAMRTVVGEQNEFVSQPGGVRGGSRVGWLGEAAGYLNVTVKNVEVTGAKSLGVDQLNGDTAPGSDVQSALSLAPAMMVSEPFEHGGPTWGSGARTWCFSPDGAKVAFSRNEAGFGRLCTANLPAMVDDTNLAEGNAEPRVSVTEIGKAVHYGISWEQTSSGRQRIAAVRTGGRTPTQLVVYDWIGCETPTRSVIARGPVGGWEELDTPEPTVVSWDSQDGSHLYGRLYLPNGVPPLSGWPLIVSVHGGPTGQTQVQFNARFAYWLASGWAIFAPDYRGSSGWGRDYRRALNGLWGERDWQDVWRGINWVTEHAHIDSGRLVPIGGSAGGFTVLGLLASFPGQFAAAVVLYPVTDLDALDATTHRYERCYNEALIGRKPNAAALYRSRSPVEYADRITTPLLVLHGDSDLTVDVRQSVELVRRMHEQVSVVALHVYEGEGHGWKKAETTIDELNRVDAFLLRYANDALATTRS